MRQAGEVTYADTHKGRKNEGVIEFRQYSDMKRALEKLDGTEVNGRKIRLIEDRPGAKRRRSYSRSRSRSRSEVVQTCARHSLHKPVLLHQKHGFPLGPPWRMGVIL